MYQLENMTSQYAAFAGPICVFVIGGAVAPSFNISDYTLCDIHVVDVVCRGDRIIPILVSRTF